MANPASPATSMAAVLNTTELLESILLKLDNRTLLLSQRTNQAFKATVEESVRLQQKLFFKPTPPGSAFDCKELDCWDIACSGAPAWPHFNPLFTRPLAIAGPNIVVTLWGPHPPLNDKPDDESDKLTLSIMSREWFSHTRRYQYLTTEDKAETMLRIQNRELDEGSWRRMLGQPSAGEVLCFKDLGEDSACDSWHAPGPQTVEELLEHFWPAPHAALTAESA
jgi:hypothetical protein